MASTKEQKKKILADLKDKVARQKAIVLVGITKLKVKDVSDLKKNLKAVDAKIQVVKKTLAEIALKDGKMDFDKKNFKEEIALIFGFKDEISPAKIAYQFSRSNENLKILGGYLENKYRDREEMIALAQLPAKEELLARLVYSINAPLSGFVNVLEGNIKGLLYALSTINK